MPRFDWKISFMRFIDEDFMKKLSGLNMDPCSGNSRIKDTIRLIPALSQHLLKE